MSAGGLIGSMLLNGTANMAEGIAQDHKEKIKAEKERAHYLMKRKDAIADRDNERAYQAKLLEEQRGYDAGLLASKQTREDRQTQESRDFEMRKIRANRSNAASKFGSTEKGINPQTGQPGMFQTNQNGDVRWLGVQPMQKNGVRYTAPDGSVVEFGGSTSVAGQSVPLGKPANNDAQERLVSHGESLARLQAIKDEYNPEFLTYQGKAKDWINNVKSKAGVDLTDHEKDQVRQHRRFSQNVNYAFNDYRKLITGAAAAVAELEDLKKAMISTDLSPEQFEAAFNTYRSELSRTMRIRNKLLREGIGPGTQQFGAALNDMYLNGSDDNYEARGAELEAHGYKPEQIINTLEQEGYL